MISTIFTPVVAKLGKQKNTPLAQPAVRFGNNDDSFTPSKARLYNTHEVKNQPTPPEDYNLYNDTVLKSLVDQFDANWATQKLEAFGKKMGSAEVIELSNQAEENPPKLKTHDRNGNRIDEVEFHPAYHELFNIAKNSGLHNLSWTSPNQGSHVARAALMYMFSQVEAGVACPVSMTHAGLAVLNKHPEVGDIWRDRLMTLDYESDLKHVADKTGATMGMAMTEKQGGSDVRANTTTATPVGKPGPGHAYKLTGHKWFCSAPMSDMFLTLAHTDKGLSCFLVPRIISGDKKNNIYIQRLKDKLGNRSNASSEIEYLDTTAYLVGEEGKGVKTIIDMVNFTRLDCALTSSAFMRQALTQAIRHADERSVFGKTLIDQPLMQNVLADLALETEAATTFSMRLARAFDNAEANPEEKDFARIATAVGKYFITKRAPHMIAEAMECLGGSGYVKERNLERLYREAPVNAIWEGSGNVQALDLLRAFMKNPETLGLYMKEVRRAEGKNETFDKYLIQMDKAFSNFEDMEVRARSLVEMMALSLEASLLLRHSTPEVAEAFCESRLTPQTGGWTFGTLSPDTDFKTIIDRARV